MRHMAITLFRIWFLVGLGCAVPAVLAEPVVHQRTGISFPDEIAGFERIGVKDFEALRPGFGFSYVYRTADGVTASVYVYTAGLPRVPDDLAHPVFAFVREQTVREVLQVAQSRGESARATWEETIKVSSQRGEVPVLSDGFIISAPAGPRNSFVWLWPARGHFIKIRMTSEAAGERDARQIRLFCESMVRRTVE
jgi:hypothetical protein